MRRLDAVKKNALRVKKNAHGRKFFLHGIYFYYYCPLNLFEGLQKIQVSGKRIEDAVSVNEMPWEKKSPLWKKVPMPWEVSSTAARSDGPPPRRK